MSGVWLKGGSGLWDQMGPMSARWQRRLMRRRREAGSHGSWRRGDYLLLDIGRDGSVGHALPAIDRDFLVLLMEWCFPNDVFVFVFACACAHGFQSRCLYLCLSLYLCPSRCLWHCVWACVCVCVSVSLSVSVTVF